MLTSRVGDPFTSPNPPLVVFFPFSFFLVPFSCLMLFMQDLSRTINIDFQKAKQLMKMKEEGNKAFRNGQYSEAYNQYSAALKVDPCNIYVNAKLFCNRATSCTKVCCIHYIFLHQSQTLLRMPIFHDPQSFWNLLFII